MTDEPKPADRDTSMGIAQKYRDTTRGIKPKMAPAPRGSARNPNSIQNACDLVKSTTQLIKDIIKIPLGSEKKKPKVPIKETSVVQAPEDYKPFEKSDDDDVTTNEWMDKGCKETKEEEKEEHKEKKEWMDKGMFSQTSRNILPPRPQHSKRTIDEVMTAKENTNNRRVKKAISELNKSMELISGINKMIEKGEYHAKDGNDQSPMRNPKLRQTASETEKWVHEGVKPKVPYKKE